VRVMTVCVPPFVNAYMGGVLPSPRAFAMCIFHLSPTVNPRAPVEQ